MSGRSDIHSQKDYDRMEQAFEILHAVATGKKQWDPQMTGFKNDPAALGGSPPYSHGAGGLLATPGVQPQLFSTVMQPQQGVIKAMPIQPQGSAAPDDPSYGGYDSPLFTTITGITSEGSVSEPNDICDDQPEGGLLKACTLTAPYGRVGRGFKINVQEIGRLVNRGEPTDLRLLNPLLDTSFPFQSPTGTPTGIGNQINMELTKRWTIAATQLQRKMAGLTWDGNPTNNSAGGGYKEYMGLNLFIAAGNKVDATNGTPCPSMDADIKNFGYSNVSAGTGNDIVQYVDMMFYFLENNAEAMGLAPVRWVIAMRRELFDELVKVWPIRYYEEFLTQMQRFTNGGLLNVEAVNAAEMRDSMRNEKYLIIRGQRVEVVIDDSIAEATNVTNANVGLGRYASDIYFVPITVLGGIPVTYWEFFNAGNLNAAMVEQFGVAFSNTWTTDGGIFRWFRRDKNGCFEFDFVTEPRIIMRTPFLSGRIQNVVYEPLQHVREPFPSDPYFVNGGRTNTAIGTYYTEYSNETPVPIG